MRSKIDLYNQALGRLGVKSLVGPDDEKDTAVFCERFYVPAVEDVLDSNHFACSVTRANLARLDETPVYGFKYAYALPGDFLHLVQMEKDVPFCIESGNRLLCNLEQCNVSYVKRITNPAEFSSWVAECIVLVLASKVAAAISDSPALSEKMLQEYLQVALPKARTADTKQAHVFHGNPYWEQIAR